MLAMFHVAKHYRVPSPSQSSPRPIYGFSIERGISATVANWEQHPKIFGLRQGRSIDPIGRRAGSFRGTDQRN
jgi:hypothetical protein